MADEEWKRAQRELKESAQKIWLAGIGALATAEEEGSKLFNSLVKKGETYEARGKQRVEEVKARVEEVVGKAEGSFEKSFEKLGGAGARGTFRRTIEERGDALASLVEERLLRTA